jgi:hypothetical protein
MRAARECEMTSDGPDTDEAAGEDTDEAADEDTDETTDEDTDETTDGRSDGSCQRLTRGGGSGVRRALRIG